MTAARTFPFRFSPAYRAAGALFGVTPARAKVSVGAGQLSIRFGPWALDTEISNVRGLERTGPYSFAKTAGPAHLSLADRGLTFATNPDRGLCIHFAEPVPGIDPFRRIRHPAVTVTVADVDGLQEAIDHERGRR